MSKKPFLCEKEGYTLVRPLNTQDMNYHLIDSEGNDFLISIDDVYDSEEDVIEKGGILWDNLVYLKNIEEVKQVSWKTIDKEN